MELGLAMGFSRATGVFGLWSGWVTELDQAILPAVRLVRTGCSTYLLPG